MSKKSATQFEDANFTDMLKTLENQSSQSELAQVRPPAQKTKELVLGSDIAAESKTSSYYDFDMAEFPWAIFEKTQRAKNGEPIIYEDEIRNPDTEEKITRRIETYPSSEHGHATHSTFELAYLLIQLYIADDEFSDRVRFGSLRNLARLRGLEVNGRTVKNIKKDLAILGSMTIKSYNAFLGFRKKVLREQYELEIFRPCFVLHANSSI